MSMVSKVARTRCKPLSRSMAVLLRAHYDGSRRSSAETGTLYNVDHVARFGGEVSSRDPTFETFDMFMLRQKCLRIITHVLSGWHNFKKSPLVLSDPGVWQSFGSSLCYGGYSPVIWFSVDSSNVQKAPFSAAYVCCMLSTSNRGRASRRRNAAIRPLTTTTENHACSVVELAVAQAEAHWDGFPLSNVSTILMPRALELLDSFGNLGSEAQQHEYITTNCHDAHQGTHDAQGVKSGASDYIREPIFMTEGVDDHQSNTCMRFTCRSFSHITFRMRDYRDLQTRSSFIEAPGVAAALVLSKMPLEYEASQ